MRFTYLFSDLQNTIYSPMAQQALVDQGLLIIEASRSHTGRLRLRRDGTLAETRFCLSAKQDESI